MNGRNYRITLREVNKQTRNHFKVRAKNGKRSLNAEINMVLDQVYLADKSKNEQIGKPLNIKS